MDAVTRTAPEVEVDASSWVRRILVWGVPLVIVVTAVYFYGSAGRFVSTDNAYLQQDRVDVASQVPGNVVKIYVGENTHVVAGQPILQLDDSLLRIALTEAQSRLSGARAEVAALKAAYREQLAEIAVARRTAEFSDRDFKRQQELADRKLISAAALDTSERAATLTHGAVGVLELQLEQTLARLGGSMSLPTDGYPTVRTALAELDHAQVNLGYTLIRAPQSGIASHLPKVGARVEVGRSAFAIVTDQSLWVEANFKETDLEWVRSGEPVAVDVDTYGEHRWSGHVESIAQATGAEFSLLPAQNATGNWVKVVQRIPVRIALDRRPDDPPLRDGMSATVEIDTGPHTRFDRWFGHRL